MARSGTGVEVLPEHLLDDDTPCCPHGPALLFERLNAKKVVETFYACSASRDRSDCPFFLKKGDKVSAAKKEAWGQMISDARPEFSHVEFHSRLSTLRAMPAEKRACCLTCGELLVGNSPQHKDHEIVRGLTDDALLSPTKLLPPLSANRTNAQYLFSDKAVDFTISLLEDLNIRKVLCVGAPRIHEVLCQRVPQIRSFLLDLDLRLQQFYPPENLCRYNMFNHHFFDGASAQSHYESFLADDSGAIAILLDPPFGGLVDALAFNLRRIWKDVAAGTPQTHPEPHVLWFFPYFLEQRIIKTLEGFKMLDYKVDYDNHADFKSRDTGGSKHGSPVRIFTNIPQEKVVLPQGDGYRFCKKCSRYVSPENLHCPKCEACTSKDGRTYVHCLKCGRCVKPSKQHCDSCDQCQLPGHKCGSPVVQGCFICGVFDHKKSDCPKRKRPSSTDDDAQRKISKAQKRKKNRETHQRKKKTILKNSDGNSLINK